MAATSVSPLIENPVVSEGSHPPPAGWREELSSIYSTHYRDILKFCQQFFRQREDAEDAAAEVFLKLHKILERRDPAMPLRPWLWQVARRHCIDKLRQRKAALRVCQDGIDVGGVTDDLTPSPLSQVLSKEKELQVREQLDRLPSHYRVPLVLRYYKQMSYREIAGALNRGLPAVRLVIFRAKNQLRGNLRFLAGPQVTASGYGSAPFRDFPA
jgi:RNA polymerase sigma-70 factor (ECF subfamily)